MAAPAHLPGIFGSLAPLLTHDGYLAVGGFMLLEAVTPPWSDGGGTSSSRRLVWIGPRGSSGAAVARS